MQRAASGAAGLIMERSAVFLSYSRANAAVAVELRQRLVTAGLRVWMDTSELLGAVRWRDEIERAIRSSVMFVVIDSPEWRASDECGREYKTAMTARMTMMFVEATAEISASSTRIAQAVGSLHPHEFIRAELCIRSYDWKIRNNPGQLANRSNMKRYRLVPAERRDELADRYFTGSRRRLRRSRMFRILGVVLTMVLLFGLFFTSKVQDKVTATINDLLTSRSQANLIASLPDALVYPLLTQAAAQRTGSLASDPLTIGTMATALALPVPDHSTELPERAPLSVTSRGPDSALVVDTAGNWGDTESAGVPDGSGELGTLVSVATSPDGRWQLEIGDEATMRRPSDGSDSAVTIACQGTHGAVANDGSSVVGVDKRLCHTSGEGKQTVFTAETPVTTVAAWNSGWAYGTGDGSIHLVTTDGTTTVVAAPIAGAPARTLSASPSGAMVAVLYPTTGSVVIIDTTTGQVSRKIANLSPQTALRWASDEQILAVGSGTVVTLVNVADGRPFVNLVGSSGVLDSLSFDPGDSGLWASSNIGRVTHWTWRTSQVLTSDSSAWITGATQTNAGVAYLDRSGAVNLLGRDGSITPIQMGVIGPATLIRASRDGTRIAVADSYDQSIVIQGHAGALPIRASVNCAAIDIAWSWSGDTIYASCGDGLNLLVIDAATGHIVTQTGLAPTPTTLRPAATIVAADAHATVMLDHAGGVWLADDKLEGIKRVGFSRCARQPLASTADPNGGRVFVIGDGGGAPGCISAIDSDGTIHPLAAPMVKAEQGRAVAVSPSGDFVAFGYSDGTVQVIDRSGLTVRVMHEIPGAVRGLGFFADGSMWAAGRQGYVLVSAAACSWCSTPDGDITEARLRINRAVNLGLWKN